MKNNKINQKTTIKIPVIKKNVSYKKDGRR